MRSFQAIPYLSIHGMKEIRVVRVTLKPWFRLFKGFVTGLKRAEMAENIRICFSLASYSLWLSLLSIKTEWTECIGESSAYSKEIEVNRFIRTRNFLRKSTDQKIASRPLIRWLVLESRELLISFWFYNNFFLQWSWRSSGSAFRNFRTSNRWYEIERRIKQISLTRSYGLSRQRKCNWHVIFLFFKAAAMDKFN